MSSGELPVFYCKHCGQELQPYWLEGWEGRIQYDESDGKPYREYEVYYKCPAVRIDFWGEHSSKKYTLQKSPDSDYRLPERLKR